MNVNTKQVRPLICHGFLVLILLSIVEPVLANSMLCPTVFARSGTSGYSAPLANEKIWEMVTDSIYMTAEKAFGPQQKRLESNAFVTHRSLSEYENNFGEEFSSALSNLGSRDLWVDFGAGSGRAQLEYQNKWLTSLSRAVGRTLAIRYKAPEEDSNPSSEIFALKKHVTYPKQVRIVEQNIEEMESIEPYILGSDVIGAFSYAKLDKVLRVELSGLIKDKGSFFLYAADIKEIREYENLSTYSYSTFVIKQDGTRLTLREWLGQIDGLQITELQDEKDRAVLKIKKTKDAILIPQLKLIGSNGEAPPGRIYQEIPIATTPVYTHSEINKKPSGVFKRIFNRFFDRFSKDSIGQISNWSVTLDNLCQGLKSGPNSIQPRP